MDNKPKTISEMLEYLNKVLGIYGKNLLNIEQLKEIHRLVLSLRALNDEGITSDNYGSKQKAFSIFKEKAFSTYGIEIEESCPFSNPKDLYIIIDEILLDASLNDEQRKHFYVETKLRERSPKKRPPKIDYWAGIVPSELSLEEEYERLARGSDEWNNLTQEEQDEITGETQEDREAEWKKQEAYEKYLEHKYAIIQKFKLLKYHSK